MNPRCVNKECMLTWCCSEGSTSCTCSSKAPLGTTVFGSVTLCWCWLVCARGKVVWIVFLSDYHWIYTLVCTCVHVRAWPRSSVHMFACGMIALIQTYICVRHDHAHLHIYSHGAWPQSFAHIFAWGMITLISTVDVITPTASIYIYMQEQ